MYTRNTTVTTVVAEKPLEVSSPYVYVFVCNLDAGHVWLHINGSYMGGGNPETGTTPTWTLPVGRYYYPAATVWPKFTVTLLTGPNVPFVPEGYKPWQQVT